MRLTGGRVVLNLEGADRMKHVEPRDFISHLRSFQGGLELSSITGKVSMAYTVLTPRPEIEVGYYRWVLKCDGYIQELRTTSNQLRDGQSIRMANLALVPLPLPLAAAQRAIADFLDRETAQIDTLIAKQQQLIGTLRERRVALAADPLIGVDPKHMTTLKRIASIQTGVTLSGEGDPDDPAWPYLRVANVQAGHVALDRITTLRLPEAEARQSLLQPGDVLMTEGGDIDKLGRGALWNGEIGEILHQNHVFAVRPSDRLDSRYLVYWLDGPEARYYFRTTARKTTNLASTNKWTLGNLPVACPGMEDQTRIVQLLDERTRRIDSLIGKAEEFITLAKERRAALITAAVTGQINVTGAA